MPAREDPNRELKRLREEGCEFALGAALGDFVDAIYSPNVTAQHTR